MKIPVLHLYGKTIWSPAEFWIKHTQNTQNLLKLVGIKKPTQEAEDVRKSALQYIDDGLER